MGQEGDGEREGIAPAVRYQWRIVRGGIERRLEKLRVFSDQYLRPAPEILGRDSWSYCTLSRKDKIAHDYYVYRFIFDADNQRLPLELGQEITIAQSSDMGMSYANILPLSSRLQRGYFDVVVSPHESDPQTAAMFDTLREGNIDGKSGKC